LGAFSIKKFMYLLGDVLQLLRRMFGCLRPGIEIAHFPVQEGEFNQRAIVIDGRRRHADQGVDV